MRTYPLRVALLLALLILPLLPGAAFAQSTQTGVVQVVDGNTFQVGFGDGSTDTMRVLGVGLSDQCLGPEAVARAHAVLDGQSVALDLDPERAGRDAMGRVPADVWLADGSNAGDLLSAACAPQLTTQADPSTSPAAPVPSTPPAEPVPAPPPAAVAPPPAAAAPPPVAAASAPQPPLASATYSGAFDPNGPDRDCPDFRTQAEAQAFFRAAGGPRSDRHRLDADHDGIACETLP